MLRRIFGTSGKPKARCQRDLNKSLYPLDIVCKEDYIYKHQEGTEQEGTTTMRNAANGKSIFQDYELDSYLGDSAEDYDRDAIIGEVTEIGNDGNRYWKDLDEDEFSAIVAKHDISEQ